jgi:hypothetical protein
MEKYPETGLGEINEISSKRTSGASQGDFICLAGALFVIR